MTRKQRRYVTHLTSCTCLLPSRQCWPSHGHSPLSSLCHWPLDAASLVHWSQDWIPWQSMELGLSLSGKRDAEHWEAVSFFSLLQQWETEHSDSGFLRFFPMGASLIFSASSETTKFIVRQKEEKTDADVVNVYDGCNYTKIACVDMWYCTYLVLPVQTPVHQCHTCMDRHTHTQPRSMHARTHTHASLDWPGSFLSLFKEAIFLESSFTCFWRATVKSQRYCSQLELAKPDSDTTCDCDLPSVLWESDCSSCSEMPASGEFVNYTIVWGEEHCQSPRPTRMWDMSVWSQMFYFGTDLCGLSPSFVFP